MVLCLICRKNLLWFHFRGIHIPTNQSNPPTMKDQLPQEYYPSSLIEANRKLAVITGSWIDAEAGLHTFREEKGYYEDREATFLASVEAMEGEPFRQWRSYLKPFVSYHDTPPAVSHHRLAEMEQNLGDKFLGLITQNVSGLQRKAGSFRVLKFHGRIREIRDLNTGELLSLPDSWVETLSSEENR